MNELRDSEDKTQSTPTGLTSPVSGHSTASPTVTGALRDLKANLYFETAEGFGDWRIYLAGRAIDNLYKVKRSDGKMFDIVVHKLKYVWPCFVVDGSPSFSYRELSNGQFTLTNQKRLTNGDAPVDIYRAWLPGDLRIVVSIILI